jgi:hypothetical protein
MHFEVPADNPERAQKFYADVFGWTFQSWPGPVQYWLATTGPKEEPGIDGGLMKRMQPGQGVVTTIAVESLDATLAKLASSGGTITAPKFAVPSVGWLAYFLDSEGNAWGAMQMDPGAI